MKSKSKKIIFLLIFFLCVIFGGLSFFIDRPRTFKKETYVQVPFKLTAGCRQSPGWEMKFSLFIDGKNEGVIDNCGSQYLNITKGSHTVMVFGEFTDQDKFSHSAESNQTTNNFNENTKVTIYPFMNSLGNYEVSFVVS